MTIGKAVRNTIKMASTNHTKTPTFSVRLCLQGLRAEVWGPFLEARHAQGIHAVGYLSSELGPSAGHFLWSVLPMKPHGIELWLPGVLTQPSQGFHYYLCMWPRVVLSTDICFITTQHGRELPMFLTTEGSCIVHEHDKHLRGKRRLQLFSYWSS